MSPIFIALIAALPGIITAISSFRNAGKINEVKVEQRRVAGALEIANGVRLDAKPKRYSP